MIAHRSHRTFRTATDSGFTLLEVMIALLIGMVGLIGSVAVQMSVLRATKNSNDAMTAQRLATQRIEVLAASNCTQGNDELAVKHTQTGANWSADQWIDANDRCGGLAFSATATPACRFKRNWKVTNMGLMLPYNLSVKVAYNLDGREEKIVRIDVQRHKRF